MNAVVSEPIRIGYTEDGAFMLEGTEMMWRSNKARPWQKWLNLAIVPLVCAVMALNWAHQQDWLGVGIALAVMVPLFWFVWRTSFPTKRSQLKRYQKMYVQTLGREQTLVTCEFGKGGYATTTDQGNTSQQTWASLVKAVENPEGLLFYTAPKIARWFPKRLFSPADYERVIEIVRANVANFQSVNGGK